MNPTPRAAVDRVAAAARQLLVAVVVAVATLPGLATIARAEAGAGAPYLRVLGGDDRRVERLPLESSRVDAEVVGAIARVVLTQVYVNRGERPVEARYVFPASARAAVDGLTMTVGSRRVRATIGERVQQRATYEAAKAEGKTAALLEQEDPSVFSMDLANVLPGDRVQVELSYSELLVPTDGVYELFVPNTFAPSRSGTGRIDRHTPESADAEVTDYSYDFRIAFTSAVPLAAIDSPSHRLQLARGDDHHATARMDESERQGSRKDLSLRFRLGGDRIESGLLLAPGGTENYFALMLEPPRALQPAAIVPREYIFVVDVSGSMHGAPLDLAKDLIDDLLAVLTPDDRFNLIQFAGDSLVLSESGSLAVGTQTAAAAKAFLARTGGHGSTELLPALERAYALPRTAGMARNIVVVTDGGIGYGGREFHLVREHVREANLFAFGVGTALDRDVIEHLARSGYGETFLCSDPAEGKALAARFRRYIDRPALSGIQVAFDGFEAYDVVPAELPDLLAERPLVLVGKYRGAPNGAIVVDGRAGRRSERIRVAAAGGIVDERGAALPQLWARRRIEAIEEAATGTAIDAAGQAEITALGLRHHLLTRYTTFLAVTDERRSAEAPVPVEQPAPARQLSSGYGSPASIGLALAMNLSANVVAPEAAVTPMVPAPARHPEHDAADRPDVVFVLGRDEPGSGYFAAASAYWRSTLPDATIVETARTLADVRSVLAAGTRPWGRVILIAHGSEWSGLTLDVDAASGSARPGTLRRLLARPGFEPLPDRVVDAATTIELESCGLGRRTAYLELLARWFGGDDAERPAVSAASGLVWYSVSPATAVASRRELAYVGRLRRDGGADAATARRRATADWQRLYGSAAPSELEAVDLPVAITLEEGDLTLGDRTALTRFFGSPAWRAEFAGSGIDPRQLSWRREERAGRGRWLGSGVAALYFAPPRD